ncbi:MAG: NAD+ synthase [archaeon GW2011_AR10]|uniref:NH(3)-dependent NAD(+) synthetase n=1 Tax=Candidatus Iainarchaeum sp. TaxID=3101447 RepID=A0A7J4IU79_9ARCH|nr:MAG: NAD+ synthase [archaeon GW2011_AR10]HIH07909.1 NAD+ synthase [Candidatus Diapherotrites archaeon]
MQSVQQLNVKLVKGLKKFFKDSNNSKAVVGLSGGIDSALTVSLTAEAIGKGNVSCIIMPLKGVSSEKNTQDALNYARDLGVSAFIVPVNDLVAPFSKLPWKQSTTAQANLAPRARAAVLYNFANSNNAVVVGTGNRTEMLLGYFTKFGDGAADVFPLGGLFKSDVRELAKFRGVPSAILEKTPTAELWKGQTDEGEIGLNYTEIDQILRVLVVKGKQAALKKGFDEEKVNRIVALMEKNRHKSEPVPVIKL